MHPLNMRHQDFRTFYNNDDSKLIFEEQGTKIWTSKLQQWNFSASKIKRYTVIPISLIKRHGGTGLK